ncbi:MAG: class I SAM-dependent methyltransferase [Flavobacteriaceae bacterium]
MPLERYGKSSSALLRQKTSFFTANKQYVAKQQAIAATYRQQPVRKTCKNCGQSIENSPTDFEKEGISYVICETCNHLNGRYEDTVAFCDALYTADAGKEYAKHYSASDISAYNYRTASIYIPKAEFLHTTLGANNVNPNELSYLDFGAGSGYFVSALKKVGVNNVTGSEVSEVQVDFGNKMIGKSLLTTHRLEDTNQVLENTTAEVVSMIGVLEHLQNPRQALNAISNNDNIKYFYFSVPTFSLAVYLELLSPDIFHRQLSCGHTHLYTKSSLQYLAHEFNWTSIGEWWFGTEMVDLFRHIAVNLELKKCSPKMIDLWKEHFIPIIDALQLEIDKKYFSSEVHILLKKQ